MYNKSRSASIGLAGTMRNVRREKGKSAMRRVVAKTSYEGVHCWPEAPEEVKYLRDPHRHIFEVVVEVQVSHNDREVEFIMLKHKINKWLDAHKDKNGVWQMDRMSCEQVAERLIELLESEYGRGRWIAVSVYEDGENGCTVGNAYDV